MQPFSEIHFIEKFLEAAGEADEIAFAKSTTESAPGRSEQKRAATMLKFRLVLLLLPCVYTPVCSQHFEELLVCNIAILQRMLSVFPASRLEFVRPRLCIDMLLVRQAEVTHNLQNFHTFQTLDCNK